MDQPLLKTYANRVQSSIVTYLRKVRKGGGQTSDTLADENALFVLSNNEDWKPKRDRIGKAKLVACSSIRHSLCSGTTNDERRTRRD
ncbi:hypothetical protein ELI04_08635 [Rhizobium leguminosarum]|nr:hypothetical protein ELI04_08635 [Rhizobium leguminosarum]